LRPVLGSSQTRSSYRAPWSNKLPSHAMNRPSR
jgi:hypothetical protein